MDKINELTKTQKEDNKILIANMMDKLKITKTRNREQSTNFLDLSQQMELFKILEARKEENYEFFGGFENAERKIIIFYPDRYIGDKSKIYNSILTVIRINLTKDQREKYEHKTYLGALMKLGLKREKIGDILVREDGADIIISKDIEKFLLTNLQDLTRFQKSEIDSLPLEKLKYIEQKKEIKIINVPSMRLDAIVGEVAKCSRNSALKYIKEERVFVNFKEELSASKQIGEDTFITIRGKGRFKINKIVGTTRSGRIMVEIEK